MTREPKIKLENLYWAHSNKTGAIPYIFNNKQTAIKIYSTNYNHQIIQLPTVLGTTKTLTSAACEALGSYFDTKFETCPRFDVFESGFSLANQIVRATIANGADNIRFSQRDIEKMRVSYNKKLIREQAKQARIEQAQQFDKADQEAIMDF